MEEGILEKSKEEDSLIFKRLMKAIYRARVRYIKKGYSIEEIPKIILCIMLGNNYPRYAENSLLIN